MWREVRGGVVTFFTMSYILVLNPLILSAAHEGIAPLGTTEQIAAGTALVAPTAPGPPHLRSLNTSRRCAT